MVEVSRFVEINSDSDFILILYNLIKELEKYRLDSFYHISINFHIHYYKLKAINLINEISQIINNYKFNIVIYFEKTDICEIYMDYNNLNCIIDVYDGFNYKTINEFLENNYDKKISTVLEVYVSSFTNQINKDITVDVDEIYFKCDYNIHKNFKLILNFINNYVGKIKYVIDIVDVTRNGKVKAWHEFSMHTLIKKLTKKFSTDISITTKNTSNVSKNEIKKLLVYDFD